MADSLQLIAVKRAIKSLNVDSLMKLMLFTTEEYDLVENIMKKALISIKNKFNRIQKTPSEWELTHSNCKVYFSRDDKYYLHEYVMLEYIKTKSVKLVVFAHYKQNFIVDENNGEFTFFVGGNGKTIQDFRIEYDLFVKILSGKMFSGKITDEEIIKTIKQLNYSIIGHSGEKCYRDN